MATSSLHLEVFSALQLPGLIKKSAHTKVCIDALYPHPNVPSMDIALNTCLRCRGKRDVVVQIWYRAYYCTSCAIETRHPSYFAELERMRKYYCEAGTIIVAEALPPSGKTSEQRGTKTTRRFRSRAERRARRCARQSQTPRKIM